MTGIIYSHTLASGDEIKLLANSLAKRKVNAMYRYVGTDE